MAVRLWLGCVAFLGATVTARAQTYYYYPSSVSSAPAVTAGSYTTWSSSWSRRYQRRFFRSGYFSQNYQTPYAPVSYQTAYTTQDTQIANTQRADQVAQTTQVSQTADTAQVTQASYVVEKASQPAETAVVATSDPYGFTAWLNATRAAYGLPGVGYDPNLSNWAAMNNSHQASYGIGHFVMGPARRQNSAMGGFPGIESMWMASPAHAAALLDPTIRWIGIAGLGAYWTFNAY
jgi:hypothetical protein